MIHRVARLHSPLLFIELIIELIRGLIIGFFRGTEKVF